MSRILKRPMFRDGGRANSKGTGIMTGIEDREEYQTGGDVKTIFDYMNDPRFQDTYKAPFVKPGSPVSQMITRPQRMEMLGFLGENIPSSDMEIPLGEEAVKAQKTEPFLSKRDVVTGTQAEEDTPTPTPEPTPEPKLFGDEDLYEINEESIKERAKLYEDMLSRSRKEKIFDVLTAAAPGLLEGDYGKAIQAAGTAAGDDVEKQAKLLAIQEDIEMRKQKLKTLTPTALMANIDFLTSEKGGGLSVEQAINRLAPTASSFTKDYTPSKQIFEYSQGFQDNLDNFVSSNASGYGVGMFLSAEYSIPTQTYEFDTKSGERIPKELGSGEIVWDPENLVLKAKSPDGELKFFDFDKNDLSTINPAVKYARGQ